MMSNCEVVDPVFPERVADLLAVRRISETVRICESLCELTAKFFNRVKNKHFVGIRHVLHWSNFDELRDQILIVVS